MVGLWLPTSRKFGTATDNTTSVTLGDVDGDSDLDITVGHRVGQNVVYLNDADGNFNFNTSRNFGVLEYKFNEYYELAYFQLLYDYYDVVGQWRTYEEDVHIRDKETSELYKHTLLDAASDILARARQRLIAELTNKSNAKEKSTQVLNDVLDCKDSWEIEEVSEKVYLVEGYGLGYEEDLTTGSWYYYIETGSLEPRDSASIKLREILTASPR